VRAAVFAAVVLYFRKPGVAHMAHNRREEQGLGREVIHKLSTAVAQDELIAGAVEAVASLVANDSTWTWEVGGIARAIDRSILQKLRKSHHLVAIKARLRDIILAASCAARDLSEVLANDLSLSLEIASSTLEKSLNALGKSCPEHSWVGCSDYGVKCILMELHDYSP
jgi:hypothetical protein